MASHYTRRKFIQTSSTKVLNDDGEFVDRVITYNASQMWEFHRHRTEKVMRVLRCIIPHAA